MADLVWPALLVSLHLSAGWCIAISLVIESLALVRFLHIAPAKALAASLAMNLVSAFLGSLLIPLIGIRWEVFAGLTYQEWLNWGTFNPITAVATWLIAILVDTGIELFVLWLVFHMHMTRRLITVMLLANGLTVSAAALAAIFAGF